MGPSSTGLASSTNPLSGLDLLCGIPIWWCAYGILKPCASRRSKHLTCAQKCKQLTSAHSGANAWTKVGRNYNKALISLRTIYNHPSLYASVYSRVKLKMTTCARLLEEVWPGGTRYGWVCRVVCFTWSEQNWGDTAGDRSHTEIIVANINNVFLLSSHHWRWIMQTMRGLHSIDDAHATRFTIANSIRIIGTATGFVSSISMSFHLKCCYGPAIWRSFWIPI